MSRSDILFKNSVSKLPQESSRSEAKKPSKLGVKLPSGRDLGGVPGTNAPKGSRPASRAAPSAPASAPAPTKGRRPGKPAFKAAYFNKDISGVNEPNQRSSRLQALRGAEGATDLRKVVLPPALGVERPEPEQLREAAQLMGMGGELDLSLQSLLGRQGEWARAEGVTVEMLEERMRQLEAMVEARKAALARILEKTKGAEMRSPSIAQAAGADGHALEQVDDLAAAGKELIDRNAERADGMHRRLAKMLGIKPK